VPVLHSPSFIELHFVKKFYKQEWENYINRKMSDSSEYYGYINDCKDKIIRKEIIDKNLLTNCDWTNISNKYIGKGLDGEVWLVKCNSLK
jgi:hypothetical protein